MCLVLYGPLYLATGLDPEQTGLIEHVLIATRNPGVALGLLGCIGIRFRQCRLWSIKWQGIIWTIPQNGLHVEVVIATPSCTVSYLW